MAGSVVLNKKSIKETEKGILKESFPVLEMTCAACAVSVESMLKSMEGVKDAGVNYANSSAWVEYDPEIVNPELFQKTIRSIGYDIIIEKENAEQAVADAQLHHYEDLKKRTIWSSILSLPIVIIGMFFMNMPYANYIMLVLATPVLFYFGQSFFINAWKQAKHRKANMDTLVALSTGIAFVFSAFNTFYPQFWHERGLQAHVYFEAAAVIIAFITLGKFLEERAKSNTSSALKKLMGLQPKTVTVLNKDNVARDVPVSDIMTGDVILVKPGEKIAVDGMLTGGVSYVDESMITGEPIAVSKKTGDKVFAGTINQKGSFQFIAEKVGSQTLLAQIIKMVKEAQGSKAPVQKLVDKIAGIFVPVVIIISIVTFITWMVWGGENALTHAMLTAITVLVIACPCALGLATPTAIMVGVGKGAENNILIKDAESLELAHKVNAVIMDKTGTITEGKPKVTDTDFFDEANALYLKQILVSIEQQSEHPLAEAVVNYFNVEPAPNLNMGSIQSITGKGVKAEIEGKTYLVGNVGLMKDFDVDLNDSIVQKINAWQRQAKTVILFAEEKKPAGVIAIADKVKEGSAKAVSNLKNAGIDVYMLTGDNLETASSIASQVGITNFKAEMLPSDKAAFVKELQAKGKFVAMVGDGINDSQAMAHADVSIAMGKGSDIAMDVAKMTLITSDLNSIPKALKLSRFTVATVRQNLFWAFIYNLVGIPLAAGVLYSFNGFLLNPMIAGAAMALSSFSVVGNSLRLKLKKL